MSASEVQRRVEYIADLIARGAYIKRATPKKLAAEWGCSPTTVEHYAAEARRLLNMDRASLEETRDEQLARLDMIAVQAMAKKEFRSAVAAIETASRIAGTQAAQRHELVGSLLVSPLWLDVRARILKALAPFPEARKAVVAELAAVASHARSVPAELLPPPDEEAPA